MMLDTPEWAERQRLQNRWFNETDEAEIAKIEQRVNEINESGVLDAIQSKRKQLQEMSCIHDIFPEAGVWRPRFASPIVFRLGIRPHVSTQHTLYAVAENASDGSFLCSISAHAERCGGIPSESNVVSPGKEPELLNRCRTPPFNLFSL
jgi:hypothetical protein